MSNLKMMVYGTLMKGYGNHPVLGESKFISKCRTKNKYRMSASGIPYVNNKHEDVNISGELYDVSEDQLPYIDMLEGHPSFYTREEIQVIDEDNNEHTAWLYFCNDGGGEIVESGDYRDYRPLKNYK